MQARVFIFCLFCYHVAANVVVNGDHNAIARWLQHLEFTLPYITLPGPVVDIKGGVCTDLRVGDIQTLATGTTGEPEIFYHLTGIRLRCQITNFNNVIVNFAMNNTVLEYRVSVEPWRTENPLISLPMGPVRVKHCSVTGQLEYLDFSGNSVLSPMLETMHNQLRTVLEQEGPSIACKLMSGYIAEQATQLLADQARKLVPFFGAQKPGAYPTPVAELTNWSVYPPVQVISRLMQERPEAVKQLLGLADPLDIPQITDRVNQSIKTSLGSIEFSTLVDFVHVKGLKTVHNRSFRLQGKDIIISAEAAFDKVAVTTGMTVSLNLLNGSVRSKQPLVESLNFTLDMKDLALAIDILAMVSKPAIDALYVDQFQQPRCIAGCAKLATYPWNDSLGLWEMRSNMTPSLAMGFRQGTLEAQVARTIDTTVAAAVRDYLPAVQALIEGSIQVQRSELSKAMWNSIDSLPQCLPTAMYLGPGPYITALLLWGGLAVLFYGFFRAAENNACDVNTICDDDDHDLQTKPRLDQEKFRAQAGNSSGILSEHPCVPKAALSLYPTVAIAALCLFLYSDVCLATSINFVFRYGDHTLTIGPALAFSVVIVAVDSFQAGAYLIALCMGIMSITWPFVKIISLLVAWRAPLHVVSYESRNRLLVFLDEYGKWSLIDTWLGILALACYKLAWHSEDGNASFIVDPVPEMPFFMFVFASVLTLVLGHIASGYHRRAAEWDAGDCQEFVDDHDVRRPLYDFMPPGFMATCLVASLVATAAIVIAGARVATFEMVESGALATLLLDEKSKINKYSLISLGQSMTEGKSGDVGLHIVRMIFFFFALIIPLVLLGVLLILCVVPLKHQEQALVFDICRALDAWAALDVFAMAVTVSHAEFGLFSKFIMHYNNLAQGCKLVGDYLHTECFHMECNLTVGYSALFVAAILSNGIPKLALNICGTALVDRLHGVEFAERERLHSDSPYASENDEYEGFSSTQ